MHDVNNEAEGQECVTGGCGNWVPEERVALGYHTCIECGSPKEEFTVAPAYNKGAYQLVSRRDVKDIGRA